MNIFELKNFTFKYSGADKNALEDISLTISEGEFILLCGSTGCGKTTLLRSLKTCLCPGGSASGSVIFCSKPLNEADDRLQASMIGFVTQDAENQTVTDTVWHELAFGLESLGCDSGSIRRRAAETAEFFGIGSWFHKNTSELSGGQKQLLNLASVMIMRPKVLILDEPTSQLDPIAAQSFLDMVSKINRETGTTVIITEHRTESVFPLCSRVLVMDGGQIVCDEGAANAGRFIYENKLSVELPCAMRVYFSIGAEGEIPITVQEGRAWLSEYAHSHELYKIEENPLPEHSRKPAAELRGAWFRYSKDDTDAAKGVNLKIYCGSLLAAVGGNGAGKSTMLSLLSGINKAYRGKVLINGKNIEKTDNLYDGIIGVLPQNPQLLFTRKTVRAELEEMLDRMPDAEKISRVNHMARLCRLTELLDSHPYDLSGGEKQRAALAKVLMRSPKILLLDEPTKGIDPEFKDVLASILKALAKKGTAVVMVSHDIEFCAAHADRCAMYFDGEAVCESDTRDFFAKNSYYTTAAARIAAGIIENAVTAEDIIYACTGRRPKKEDGIQAEISDFPEARTPSENKRRLKEYLFGTRGTDTAKLSSGFTWGKALSVSLLIPLTIFIGIYYLADREYLLISVLVMLEASIPLVINFEKKKPSAREIVTIAVMCAVAAAGRCAFWFIPQLKLTAAIVIITGAALGAETGFLTGCASMLISNFFFGLTVMTPWQMFAMGLIGLTSGLMFRHSRRGRLPLSVFGAAAVLLIYGGILNPAVVIATQAKFTAGAVIASYSMGLPFDLIHAVSTAVFLWFGSQSMMEKLERAKRKL